VWVVRPGTDRSDSTLSASMNAAGGSDAILASRVMADLYRQRQARASLHYPRPPIAGGSCCADRQRCHGAASRR
jgi:hypothetical protein